ncbi:MAG: carbohydrate-binding protein [Mangrovibacterium sp.]
MKTKFLKSVPLLLLLGGITGCADYDRTGVEKSIYMNEESLSLFVGDQVQLTVSPTEGIYEWSSEDLSVATITGNGLVEAIGEGSTNIVAISSDAQARVPVNVVIRIPLTDVQLSQTSVELSPGDQKAILVTLIPENANDIPESSWHSENPDIVVVSKGGQVTAIGEGVTNIVYRIGDIVKTITADISYTRPFKGPHILSATAPCMIPAANFDFGGEGYAFHDSDTSDSSGQGGSYRRNGNDTQSDAVDIEGDGVNIGYTSAGEWLLYTVEVADAGEYLVEANVAVPGTGSFHLKVDDVNVTGTVGVPNTGGWGNFQWEDLTLNLTEGRHKIKYHFEGGHNLKELRFTKQ